jgi:hypothetical protein
MAPAAFVFWGAAGAMAVSPTYRDLTGAYSGQVQSSCSGMSMPCS